MFGLFIKKIAGVRFILAIALLLLSSILGAADLNIKNNYRYAGNKTRSFRKSTRLIVLHTTEAPTRSSLNKLSARGEAHYCVTPEGEVYRIVDRDRLAKHAGRSIWNSKQWCDSYSVGIEVVGYHDSSLPVKQLDALKELISRLQKIYSIRDEMVVSHSQVAYGLPNQWFKRNHRGRKRCGMLFAMPSVRAKLGLKSRMAFDPDVEKGFLFQADPYLGQVLYGKVDTMRLVYGKAPAQIAVNPCPRKSTAKTQIAAASKTVKDKATNKGSKPAVAAKATAAAKAKDKPKVNTSVKKTASASNTKKTTSATTAKKDKTDSKTKPKTSTNSTAVASAKNKGDAKSKDKKPSCKTKKDLEALSGYICGGPVTLEKSAFKIAGVAWRKDTTYYYLPNGRIVAGDKMDEKSVPSGAYIYYKK